MNNDLLQFLTKGYLKKTDILLSIISPGFVSNKNAGKLIQQTVKKEINFTSNTQIVIQRYAEKNPCVLNIQLLLHTQQHPAITAAIIHGSIASNETIKFSDFDGILLINRNLINTKNELIQLYKIIRDTEKLMFEQDPLQHHGWHMLFSDELANYPDIKIPHILFNQSKIIYPPTSITISFNLKKENQNYQINYNSLAKSILNKLKNKSYEQNFYSFKNLVSEILLLPAVFIQAVNNEPVLKKDSFQLTEKILPASQYTILAEVENLRRNWSQSEVKVKNERIAKRFKNLKLIQNLFRTPLPIRYKNWFNVKRTKEMNELIEAMTTFIKTNVY